MSAAVFLDRDGTVIEEVGYLDSPERVALFPWTIDAIRSLNRAGLRVVIVTNQSGVARGYFTEATVEQVHRRVSELLAVGGASVDAYYYCPHHPSGSVAEYTRVCDCRKPAPGLVDRAVQDLGVDPRQSVVVGDRWLDIAMAQQVGARGVLVRTGYGAIEEQRHPANLTADTVVNNLVEAVSWALVNIPPFPYADRPLRTPAAR